MTGKPRFVFVDTNCFIRLYGSPVLPLLGQDVGGYRLLTLQSLAEEFLGNETLVKDYCWVAQEPRVSDLKNSCLKLRGLNQRLVAKRKGELQLYARTLLESYSRRNNISPPKHLSSRDLELLATALQFKGIVATDEWPLTLVVQDLKSDPDYDIDIFSSLDVLHLLERNGKLTAKMRRQTVEAWVRLREKLPKTWRQDYQQLFGESTDSLGKP